MGWARVAIAVGMLVALVGGGAALAAWALHPAAGGEGAFDVEVVGPSGALFHGTVAASNATAYSLLQRACARANLTIETQQYPGMGLYVRSVGGYAAHGASGWIYEVERDGTWVSGDRAADRYPVRAGEALRWSWTDG